MARSVDGSGTPGLGHTRLAIIDLIPPPISRSSTSRGPQPHLQRRDLQLHRLRAELKALGHHFRSEGDGEVILRAYDEWGVDCLTRLNGMFAVALWDGRRQRLLLARDRFGESRCSSRAPPAVSSSRAR
jgi:asparagine synthase (glutamine-hydrolysing)